MHGGAILVEKKNRGEDRGQVALVERRRGRRGRQKEGGDYGAVGSQKVPPSGGKRGAAALLKRYREWKTGKGEKQRI